MTVLVLFTQHSKILSTMECKNLDEALKTAEVLNDGLQAKAIAQGFKYVVKT